MHTFALVLSPTTATNVRWGAGILIPLLVGAITKARASDGVKSTVMVCLSALSAATTALLQPGNVHVDTILRDFIMTVVIAVASYYGVWKQNGIAGTIAAATPDFGFGSPPALETAEKGAEDTEQPDVGDLAARVDALEARAAKKAPAKKAAKKATGR